MSSPTCTAKSFDSDILSAVSSLHLLIIIQDSPAASMMLLLTMGFI